MSKGIEKKRRKSDPLRVEVWDRCNAELRLFIEEHGDMREAAKRLDIDWQSLRNLIYITDYPRLPRVLTFVKWGMSGVVDVNYILFGIREGQSPRVRELQGKVKELEAQLRQKA